MAFASQPTGVLCAYFVNTQLAEWSPPELRKQQTKQHRHDWAQPQVHPDSLLASSKWEATCTECLCKLRVRGILTDRTTTADQVPCTDELGHHFHTRLSDTPVSHSLGRGIYDGGAWCCKCNSQVELSLTSPVISSLQVAALEHARMEGHEHHGAQAVRELLVTLKTMFRITRNAVRGDARPIKASSAKPRQLLKFDVPCNEVLAAIGFGRRGDEFHPPEIVKSISDPQLKPSVHENLSYQRLAAAQEELLVVSGKFMRKLPPSDRDPQFRYLNGASTLVKLLGSDGYPKQSGSLVNSSSSTVGTRSSLEESYRRLGVPEDAADSLVAWAYLRQTEEDESDDPVSGQDALKRFDALLRTAEARSSKELDELVTNEQDRGLVATDALRSALGEICGDRMLEVDAVGVDSIYELFTARLGELGKKKDKLRLVDHLKVLATARRDQALKEYVENVRSVVEAEDDVDEGSRMISPMSQTKRSVDLWPQLPTGLKNIGNTCYLNCMLQCLFSITPIRAAVMQFGDGKTWNEDAIVGRRDGSHTLPEVEIRRALRFVQLLKNLFVTLVNQRADNYAKSGSSGNHPLASPSVAVAPARELADMLLLAGGNGKVAETANGSSGASTKAGQARSFVEQQDVDECLDQCIRLLEHALPPDSPRKDSAGAMEDGTEGLDNDKEEEEPKTWIHQLLIGNLEYTNGQTDKGEAQTTHELFHNLLINIPDTNSDINECLDGFFADDTVAKNEKDVVRQSRLRHAPPVLFMQVQRVQFDKTTMQPFKVNSHIRLRDQISLARFRRDDGASGDARRCDELRKRLSVINRHLQTLQVPVAKESAMSDSVIPVIERAQSFLAGVSTWTTNGATKQLLADLVVLPSAQQHALPDLAESAKLASDQLTQMLTTLRTAKQTWEIERQRIHQELENIYTDIRADDDMAYTLHAVFIHSGVSSEYGHYWVYIRDRNPRTGETRWVKFNDSDVAMTEASEVIRDAPIPGEENANPYYLVYVRNQELQTLVDLGSVN